MADFRSLYLLFKSEYISHGGDELKHITPGDSFLSFITLYGYKELLAKSDSEIKKLISLNYTEFELMSKKQVDLRMTASMKKPSVLTKLLTPSQNSLKVGFIYEKTSASSSWTYSHELGRAHLEESLKDEITTVYYDNVTVNTIESTLAKAIAENCDVIFTTSPAFPRQVLNMPLPTLKFI